MGGDIISRKYTYEIGKTYGIRKLLRIFRNENGNYEPHNCQWITVSENTIKANKTCQHRKANKGTYYGVDPNGIIYNFQNANQFAREHNLNPGRVRQVGKHEKKSHHGWKLGTREPEYSFILEDAEYAI